MSKLDEFKNDIINLYNDGFSTYKLGSKYNVSDETIRSFLERNNVSRRRRKYILNENFFETIDTESKAYWLGFIMAEGNIDKGNARIKLGADDKDHLYKLRDDIESNYDLHKASDKNAYILNLCSMKIVRDLAKFHVIPNKSRYLKFPELDKNFINHFIRGFYDGDGWISFYRDGLTIGFASCSEEFIAKIKTTINENFQNDKGSIVVRRYNNPNHSNCYQLTFAGNRSGLQVADFLYYNATVYMDRKYNKYIKCKEILLNK